MTKKIYYDTSLLQKTYKLWTGYQVCRTTYQPFSYFDLYPVHIALNPRDRGTESGKEKREVNKRYKERKKERSKGYNKDDSLTKNVSGKKNNAYSGKHIWFNLNFIVLEVCLVFIWFFYNQHFD